MIIKLILWDIDDVLVDTTQRIRMGQRAALDQLGLSNDSLAMSVWEHAYWYYGQADADKIITFVLAELHESRSETDIKAGAELYWHHANNGPFEIHDGIIATLEWARQAGIRQGVVSNGGRAFQMQKLADTGLIDYFDPSLIEIRDKNEQPKPSPDGISACIQRAGIETSEVVYIGNRLADVIATNRADAIAILVASGNFDFKEPASSLELERASVIVQNTRELHDALVNLQAIKSAIL